MHAQTSQWLLGSWGAVCSHFTRRLRSTELVGVRGRGEGWRGVGGGTFERVGRGGAPNCLPSLREAPPRDPPHDGRSAAGARVPREVYYPHLLFTLT